MVRQQTIRDVYSSYSIHFLGNAEKQIFFIDEFLWADLRSFFFKQNKTKKRHTQKYRNHSV